MNTTINFNTCDVAELYQVCLELPIEEGLGLSDLLEERFGYGAGWKWMVREKKWPIEFPQETRWPLHFSFFGYSRPLNKEDVPDEIMLHMKPPIELFAASDCNYPTISEALLDCAKAASEAIKAKDITI